MQVPSRRVYSFKTFRFDAASGDLTHNGMRVRIQEQTGLLLSILLERAGSVVTRQELRDRMWPPGEHLGHDHAISNAVNQLRNILRDKPNKPVFIETIPKRGYRFLPAVTFLIPEPAQERIEKMEAGLISIPASGELSLAEPEPALPSALAIASRSPLNDGRRFLRSKWLVAGAMLIAVAAGWFGIRRHAPQPRPVSIGIAPFQVSGAGADQLAESLRSAISDALGQSPSINVRGQHSLTGVRQNDPSLRATAQLLHLDDLLFGNFKIDDGRCDLQLELVRGNDAAHLASFHYSGTTDELASIRDRAQRDIDAVLGRPLPEDGRLQPATSPKGYEDYLRARNDLTSRSDDSLPKAIQSFKAAIAEDPGSAQAYSGMSTTYILAAEHELAPREESYRTAKKYALKSVELNALDAEGQDDLGYLAFVYEWNFGVAEQELREAVALEPNNAQHRDRLALLLCMTRRCNEALHQVDMAEEDDPLWPSVYYTEMFVATSALQDERSIQAANRLVRMKPDWPLAHDQRAWALWYARRYEEAIEEWRRMASIEKDAARLKLEDDGLAAFHSGGMEAYARLHLKAIESGVKWSHENDFQPAEWSMFAGYPDRALAELGKLVDRHDFAALTLTTSPLFLPLHKDPRFQALVVRMGLHTEQD
jgi:DNA-binding winged helix-turn-helix (wHTH) protein/Tfp pilus assembly protein PilF/TolB-like protein